MTEDTRQDIMQRIADALAQPFDNTIPSKQSACNPETEDVLGPLPEHTTGTTGNAVHIEPQTDVGFAIEVGAEETH